MSLASHGAPPQLAETFLQRIERHSRQRPEAVAISCGDVEVTWHEVHDQAVRLGAGLRRLGGCLGDRVAFIAENSAQYALAFVGTSASGFSAVTLPTSLTPQSLGAMLDDSRPKFLFASEGCRELADRALDARALVEKIETIGLDFAAGPWRSYSPWLASIGDVDAVADVPGDTEFNVVYSSGTTGVPKGIAHSHRSRAAFSQVLATLSFDETAVNVIATPLYSNMSIPLLLTLVWVGGRAVILPRFEPEAYIDAADHFAATHFVMVPTMAQRVLDSEKFTSHAFRGTRFKYVAGSAVTPQLKAALIERWPGRLAVAYGQTEGGPYTLQCRFDDPAKLESVGMAVDGCEIAIVDEDGTRLGVNAVGEIAGRMCYMMTGYINKPEETERISWHDRAGRLFFKTGDLGRLDQDGYLFILDRKKDVIISGGFNIYATDLEQVLCTHPAVLDAAVIGARSQRWGETPIALVTRRTGATAAPEELLTWSNERLGRYQRLSYVEIVDELPRNPAGKILKGELRSRWTNHEFP